MRPFILLLFLALVPRALPAQDTRVRSIHVAGNVHMLIGRGGNIGVSVGKDGPFLIDDQFAPLVDQIKAAVRKLDERPVRFVINTHWHGDHTGGNERFGKAGAIVVAHRNVRRRMSVEQFMKAFGRKVPPAPEEALPVITFTDSVTLHWNGDDVAIFHVPHAHTDGDAIVHFPKANVIHMGDTFFNGSYPFIDTGSGGSLHGLLAAVRKVLAMCDERTKVIPGHGPLGDRDALQRYLDMLTEVHRRVSKLVREGKSADDIVAARPTAEWDDAWGRGFMSPERFLRIVVESVQDELGSHGHDEKRDVEKEDRGKR